MNKAGVVAPARLTTQEFASKAGRHGHDIPPREPVLVPARLHGGKTMHQKHQKHTTSYAITAICTRCGGQLQLRQRHDRTGSFLGCTSYPACRATLPYDQVMSDLAARLHAAETRLPVTGLAPAALDRELRRLLGFVHPDKWQNSLVAEELTKAIVDLRERLQKRF